MDLKIAMRDSNIATRPYVIVNTLLAKHLPVTPSISLECFNKLGKKVADLCKNEKVLVIGFAETATAVGAEVASCIDNAVYVHTTREIIDLNKSDLVVDFLEEHSHSKNQSLYLLKVFKDLSKFDTIVFVEDEITTGKTILNFLKNIDCKAKIIVCALVFNNFKEQIFEDYNAKFCCLKKIGYSHEIFLETLADTRLGVSAIDYKTQCTNIITGAIKAMDYNDIKNKDILVIGTEEFMYPALLFGKKLEYFANSVASHSTTRSPITPKTDKGYPINSREEFKSVYDDERVTYLYNLKKYDTVIILTNSKTGDFNELKEILQNYNNQIIYIMRFVDDK